MVRTRLLLMLLAVVGCAAAPAPAGAQNATAGVGLSDSAAALGCTLYTLNGCPVPDLTHALFDRYQALSADRTGGANSFKFVRTGIPWDAVSTGAPPIGGACTPEAVPPAFYGVPWIALAENYLLAARRAGVDPLIAITTNSAARYSGNGNPGDPANPSANQYLCGFRGIVSTLEAFAMRHGIAPPTEYETYDEPDGARVSDECNPTPAGALPANSAEQCAAWYYYEADVANRATFGGRLTLVALSADGDSANDQNLVAIKAYASYLTGTIGLYPSVWSVHPYEDLSAAAYLNDGGLAYSDTARVSTYIASLYRPSRAQPTIWLTEAAAQLTDPVPTYLGVREGCDDHEADDPTGSSLGACLDGNSRAQAYAASDFLSLARAGSAFPGQITRVYWHQFDSASAHPTTWDSGLVAPGDRFERVSYCVLTGESVTQALADPSCNRTAAAEDSQDSAGTYPEPDAGPTSAPSSAQIVSALDPSGAAPADDPAYAACPQPWCSFSVLRLRLTEIGNGG
jgi:hypothetical protein